MEIIEGLAIYGHAYFRETACVALSHDVVQLTSDQAPVAALVPDGVEFTALAFRGRAEIRIHDGHFYRQQLASPRRSPLTPESENLGEHLNTFYGHHTTVQQARRAVKEGLAGIVLIDGTFWVCVEEPVLVVDVNGMFIEVGTNTSYVAPARTFAFTEAEAAVKAARMFRDENFTLDLYYPSARNPGVEVLIPSAFTLAPNSVRMALAQDEAEAAARYAIALLGSVDIGSLHEAGTMLLAAAARLDQKTYKA